MLKHVLNLYKSKGLDAVWKWAMEPKTPLGKSKRFGVLVEFAKRRIEAVPPDEKDAWRKRREAYDAESDKYLKRHKNRHDNNVPPVADGGWHPDATRTQTSSGSGGFINVPPKLVWHTTEGFGLPTYSGSAPHFTLDPKTGKLYQHVPITASCFALRNLSGGVETNHAHAVQVELIGFASQSQDWSDSAYAHIAKLARWIEKHASVERKCSVHFGPSGSLPPRLSGDAWNNYRGHLGHQHVPEQDHWDPGALRIDKII